MSRGATGFPLPGERAWQKEAGRWKCRVTFRNTFGHIRIPNSKVSGDVGVPKVAIHRQPDLVC